MERYLAVTFDVFISDSEQRILLVEQPSSLPYPEFPEEYTPVWIWVIVAIGLILIIITSILLFRMRRI